MEKASTSQPGKGPSGLIKRLTKKKDSLINTIMPGWSDNRIENMLFVHGNKATQSVATPRGFKVSDWKTAEGRIKVYETGKGPTVVFVHGWGGNAGLFFPLMRGLSQCGFHTLAFDHLGHGASELKPAALHQHVASVNHVLDKARRSQEGLYAVVGHSTGCNAVAGARNLLIRDLPLFMISPVFNYKLFFLRELVKLKLHADTIKQYANGFARAYRRDYEKLELGRTLEKYADCTVIAHDESDRVSAISESARFCSKHPLTKLLVTRDWDHVRIIQSESVWQELKTHLNYDDTMTNFTAEVIYQ